MSSVIYSHPHLELNQHIDQVERALTVLLRWHSPKVAETVMNWLPKLARFHDLGKGATAFQIYIRDPQHYRGDPAEKAHTALSLLLTLKLAQQEKWNELDALALAAVVRGHHTALPTLPERKIGAVSDSDRDLNQFAGGHTAQVLLRQLADLDYSELERQTKLPVSGDADTLSRDPARHILRLKRYLDEKLLPPVQRLNASEGISYRLKVQLLFSLLLEADKALLAVAQPETYLRRDRPRWQGEWVEQRIAAIINRMQSMENPTPHGDHGQMAAIAIQSRGNPLRTKIREEVKMALATQAGERIFSLTAPTGCGKTLLAATWALSLQEKIRAAGENPPKIIVVLPFLSVIDQTVKEYRELLALGGGEYDGSWLMSSHSLADRSYAQGMEAGDERFFLDTWRSELIITTYDQFLMSLMDPKARYQMRFHHLCDALIIMDEVQSLPCRLWQPLDRIFQGLVELGGSKLLLMSATLPAFVAGHAPLLKDYPRYFSALARYKLVAHLEEMISLDEFCAMTQERLSGWLEDRQRVLLTLNTRGSARKVWQEVKEAWPEEQNDIPLYFISADVTPKDRMDMVDQIKKGTPCIVVSTQSIEAGVDIDLDWVLRDFAPLDSLIQIAGRCNREGRGPRGTVEIYDICNDNGRRYSGMIYDGIHLQITRTLLQEVGELHEEDVLPLAESYFAELSQKKDTGREHLERFSRWLDDAPVRELLRGKERLQYTFLVSEQDPGLLDALDAAGRVEDRWERREAWRSLAARIARVSIQIDAKPGFSPRHIANEHPGELWVLRPGYYSTAGGLNIEGETMIF